ncbi:hypothetical protein ACFU96_21820 [Streptomyces sp. NPDC057620]|uniref:hypothetical protein n=1 Tax=Streptomyces sp. NPDC057620 TaxID=3346185 RepID=UPI0036C8E376
MRYPTLYAGQRLTGLLLQQMLPDVIVKGTNEDRASTTTVTNDAELVATLEANALYHITFFIHFAAIDAAQFQTQWSVPASATGVRSAQGAAWTLAGGAATASAADGGYHRSGVHAYGTAVRYGTRASASNQALAQEESVLTTVSGGTLALQWAQAVSNASAARVAAGSSLHVRRLA